MHGPGEHTNQPVVYTQSALFTIICLCFLMLVPMEITCALPFTHLFHSSECPIVSLVQSKNVLPLHPIMCPRTLSSECPQFQRCSGEILILMMGVSRLDIRLDSILGQPWEGPEHGITSPESLI